MCSAATDIVWMNGLFNGFHVQIYTNEHNYVCIIIEYTWYS